MLDPELMTQAQDGDRVALERIVIHAQDRIHRLAMRMLADPDHAQDATQDILIRVITNIGSFRGEADFDTWVYRIATNHLLTAERVLARVPKLAFDDFETDLANGLVDDAQAAPEDHLTLNTLRISCTMAMLLCLDPNHRVAYVLGDIFEMDHKQAAAVLEIEKPTFRKRLSRARAKVEAFTAKSCGIVNEAAACRCPRRLPAAQQSGRVTAAHPMFQDAPSYPDTLKRARRLETALRTLCAQRSTGSLPAQRLLAQVVLSLISTPT